MKKLISVLLAALMLACILPLGAFANVVFEEEPIVEEEIPEEPIVEAPIDELPPEGSVLSEGSLAIVTAVAGVAVGLGGGWLLFGRKKKTGEE